MANCVIELRAQTASFRDPEFQNYHRTLHLPPPTTVIGIVGAALGLSPAMAQDYFDENAIRIGVWCRSDAKARDLWKYNNRTNKMWLYHPNWDGSVIHRDLLVFNRLLLAFESAFNEAIDRIIGGFSSPVFGVSLGNSDSLAMIYGIHKDLELVRSTGVSNCMLQGDVIQDVLEQAKEHRNFTIYQTSEPIAYQFPLRFRYESGDYGRREVEKVGVFSVIDHAMELNFEVEGLLVGDDFIPLVEI